MRVEAYIKQLLYRYECVIVPDFGAFITQLNSTRYLAESHKFIPPSRILTFNKSIQNHDGLLAETIAKGESMDFESAKQKIHLFVSDFKSALKVNRELEIPQLGTFFLDDEDKLSFEPSSINYLVDAFGMQAISVESIAIDTAAAEDEAEEPKVMSFDAETTSETHSASVSSPKNLEENQKTKPYLKYAAVGLLALGLTGFAGVYQYNTYLVSHNDAEAQKAESLLQERIQSAEFNYTLTELPLSTVKFDAESPKYHIVAGAFRVKANAAKKVELLKARGYDARVIDKNAYGLHQVAFASYEHRNQALMQLRKIKSLENPEAWLYVKQL